MRHLSRASISYSVRCSATYLDSLGDNRLRTTLNFILDFALLVVFLALAWTMALFRFAFPPATTAQGWLLWGRSYDDWSAIQFVIFCLFGVGILFHLMLHWSWICGVITSRLSKWRDKTIRWDEGAQTLYGVIALVALLHLLGAGVFAAMLAIAPPG